MKLITSNIPKELYRITPIAVNFYKEHYFTPKAKDRIEQVSIRFISSGYTEAEDTMAYCDYEEDGGYPTEYDIVFNNRKYRDIKYKHYITTIFHELTHANQYLTGRMKQVSPKRGDPYTLWEGKKYAESVPYWNQPWEIEAYGTEACAYAKFADVYPELQLKRYKNKYNGRSVVGPIDDRIDLVMKRGKK